MKNAVKTILTHNGYEETAGRFVKVNTIDETDSFVTITVTINEDENGNVSVSRQMNQQWSTFGEAVELNELLRADLRVLDKLNGIL